MADQLPPVSPGIAAQFGQQPAVLPGAAIADAVSAAPNLPQGDPNVPVGLPPLGTPVPQAAPAQDSTIVVTPAPAPPPKITVVPKPPGPPSAQPAGAGGPTPPSPELQALMANATEPPNPTGDAVDQALAAEATAHAAPPPPKAGDMAASGAAANAAGQAQSKALAEAGTAEQQATNDEATAHAAQAKETEQKAAEQKQIRDQAAAHVQQLREKATAEPYHSFWANKTAGQEVLAGIGILLGSASYSANHVNQAVGIIDRAIKQDFDTQQAQHAQLWKGVEAAMEEGRMLRSDQLDEMANFRARQAQTLDAVIAKGKALAGGAKNKEMAAALDAKNAQLGFERDKAYDEVTRLKAAQLETERHNKAEEAIGRAKVGVEAAKERRAAGADQDEKVIKLAGRAYPATKDAIKSVKTADDAAELVNTLKTNPSSLASSLGLERLVSVFSGGGRASITALKMVKPNAGSWLDVTADDISRAFTGTQGSALRSNLTKVAEEEARHADEIVSGHREKARGALKGLAKHAPDAVENYITGIFGSPRAAAPTLPPGAVMGTYKGQRGYAVPGGQFVPLAQ